MVKKIFNDAYCHIGLPRFGAPEEALEVFDRWNIQKGVFVLGPGVPDYASLFAAIRNYPDRIRGIGLPFGSTAEKRLQMTEVQIRAGISGMRMDTSESLENPDILTRLGEQGLWIYAVSLPHNVQVAQLYVEWLEQYPNGHIAAPHFLDLQPFDLTGDEQIFAELLSHPRFSVIFSRHGHMGSQEPYPHTDFLPWVKQVVEYCSWDRILWGSEYPVHYWRNEKTDECQHWIEAFGISMSEEEKEKFWSANTERLLFSREAPKAESVQIPAWVDEEFDKTRTLPLFSFNALDIPMDVYAPLLSDYIRTCRKKRDLKFSDYVLTQLAIRSQELGKKEVVIEG
jgi:predicted TIM-barrel fold metal-dependent hydrolase